MLASRRFLALRAAGLLGMAVYGVAAVGSATDRMAAAKPLWEGVVPSVFADNAWRIRALLALRRNDAPAAVAAATQAVRQGPMEQGSAELLGSALLLAERPAPADKAFRVAGQMGWRRQPTQVYWMKQAMAAGDYPGATMRLDAMLRQSPQLAGDHTITGPFETSVPARSALMAKLATRPPWLESYAMMTEGLPMQNLLARGQIILALAASGTRLTCRQAGPIVTRLLAGGQAASADAIWRASCPAQSLQTGDDNFSGGDLSAPDSPFSWLAPGDSNVSTAVDERAPPDQPRLVVSSSAPFTRDFIARMVYLPAGTYRIAWRAMTADGKGTDRIAAVLDCRQGSNAALPMHMDPRSGIVTAVAQVDDACAVRWLSFRILPGTEDLHFGHVRIDRLQN